ncbi:unnamed protein product [Candidula unifasciata]|uniref:Uncharacterized protein n=1 Tax=Candidula unifasciata TaxID=100452 RepID=A0A8S3YNV1_9EUPU|nr:unnamed protein product [Candidula unifasciata]
MDNKNTASDTDDHNTNQNDVACADRCALKMDKFEDANALTTPDKAARRTIEVNAENEKPNFYSTIPTIIVTPASPDKFHGDVITEGSKFHTNMQPCYDGQRMFGQGHESVGDAQCLNDAKLLTTPPTDTTINIQRPPISDADTVSLLGIPMSRQLSSCADATNEDDIEVMCRFSSTPVMRKPRKGQNVDNTDCSFISISDASPIPPGASTVKTPNRSSNRSICHEEIHPEEGTSAGNQPSNMMYIHPQYVIQNQSQGMFRRDIPVTQSAQPPYMAGRVIDHSYIPSSSLSGGSYTAGQNVYSTYMPPTGCYSEYFPTKDNSWTDLSYRPDSSPVPGPHVDTCCYPVTGGSAAESEYFVYPSIYVSSSGLISVLLRNDMSVEMTVDRTIRVVSHNHMMAVATDSRGTAACLYHPAVKVFQIGTTTDIATLNFRARMGSEVIVFSNGINFFKLEDTELQPTAPIKFTDIFRDQSVNLLFSSEGYGESLVASCMQVAAQAEYANLPKGGVIVRINGVKVTQTGGGDVTVVTGAKFIRLSPHFGTTRLGNRFVDIEVEKDWTVKLTRGSHSFVYSKKRAMVCNGKMEAGFDENNGLKVTNLQLRLPLLAEPSIVRRPCRKQVRLPPTSGTPKRRPGPTGTGRGNNMS